MTDRPAADGCTDPCIACMTDEPHDPAPLPTPNLAASAAVPSAPADDLPARLRTALTERFTELGNPFSEMRRHEKGPDGWPASHPVGPHQVAEVLRELLAAVQPAPAETDEERTDRITVNRDQLAALLAHHADTLAAHLRTDPARDRWIAAEQLDAHALALTAGEETSVVRELLDSILAFEAEQPATPPSAPADADLRDRIRRAICEASGATWLPDELMEPDEYGDQADAVLAVLPPSAYRRLLARLEADRAGHLRATEQAKEAGEDEVLVAVGGASAAALRHAAAMAVHAFEGPDAAQAYMQRTEGGEEDPPFDVEAGLQRLADDLQRGETAASRAALVEGPQTVTHNANESTARHDSATACGQNLRLESAPADRAAVLQEAIDRLDALEAEAWEGADSEEYIGRATGLGNAKDELRRMADEAQPAVCTNCRGSGLDPRYNGDFACPGCVTQQADTAGEAEIFSPEVVAYRHPTKPRAYLCRQHGDGQPGLTPLDSDDLEDGGMCSECGADVLAPQQQAEEA